MRQGCKIISLEDSTAIMCGGEPKDHKCNEDAVCYDTKGGERFLFKDSKEGGIWYNDNYKDVRSGSVACSVCGRALLDNAMFMDF